MDKYTDRIAVLLVKGFLKLQVFISISLSKLIAKVPVTTLRIGLLLFIITGFAGSTLLVIRGLFNKQTLSGIQWTGQMHIPKHYDKTGDSKQRITYKNMEKDQQQIYQLIKTYKDSLVGKDSLHARSLLR